jgi:hypothetical protein
MKLFYVKLKNSNPIIYLWVIAGLLLISWVFSQATPKEDRLLYSDQAVHVMIASSLWNDGDLKYTLADLQRFREDFPKETGPRGLFLKQAVSGDLYYAKPYLYGLIAGPFYGIIGTDGLLLLNIICFIIIGAIIGLILAKPFGTGWATFASLAFMLPSAFTPWLFVAHPDIFIAALLGLGSYLLLADKKGLLIQTFGAIILGAALNEKITFLVVIPFVVMAIPRVGWCRRSLIAAIIIFSWITFTSVNVAIDGSLLSYQGVRFSVDGHPFPLENGWIMPTAGKLNHIFNPWDLIFALVGNISIIPEKIIDFLVGRQTGIIPYFSFAFGILIIRPLFFWGRSALLLIAFFVYLILHWLAFPTNGYGGSGSYGPRYMLQALPLIPLSILGSDLRHYFTVRLNIKNLLKIFFCGVTLFGLLIQHKILIHGHELVRNYYGVLTTSPLNIFRLEKWLLPYSIGFGGPTQYVINSNLKNFSIFKPDATNTDVWFRSESQTEKISFVLYKNNSEDIFPLISLRSPVAVKIRLLSGTRVIWSGDLEAAEPRHLDINNLASFNRAFDLLSNQYVSWAALTLETTLQLQDKNNRKDIPSIDFAAASTPLVFDTFSTKLNVHEFVGKGGEFHSGWSHIEPWGIWSDGEIADIYLKVGEGTKFNFFLDAHAFVSKENQYLDGELRCGASDPVRIAFKQGESKTIQLNCEKFTNQKYLVITTMVRSPTSPFAQGQSDDHRLLGIGLTGIKVERISEVRPDFK